MTVESTDAQAGGADEPVGVDRAQYGLAAVLAVVGAYTIYDASTLKVGFADPVGPKVFPYAIGAVMVVLAGWLAVATARGDRPEVEGGEDIDLEQRPDLVTVAKILGIFAINIVIVDFVGWAITGALLFAGTAWALGSRTPVRDIVIGAVMSVGSWYFFYVALDIPLSAGILDGVL